MKIQLKELLDKHHMTRYELSLRTGISYIAITSIYQNKTKMIRLDNLEAICHALSCTPNDILIFDNPIADTSEDDKNVTTSSVQ